MIKIALLFIAIAIIGKAVDVALKHHDRRVAKAARKGVPDVLINVSGWSGQCLIRPLTADAAQWLIDNAPNLHWIGDGVVEPLDLVSPVLLKMQETGLKINFTVTPSAPASKAGLVA